MPSSQTTVTWATSVGEQRKRNPAWSVCCVLCAVAVKRYDLLQLQEWSNLTQCKDLLSKHHPVNTKSLVLNSWLVSRPVVSDICSASSGSVGRGGVSVGGQWVSGCQFNPPGRFAVCVFVLLVEASGVQVVCCIWFAVIFTCVVCSKQPLGVLGQYCIIC